MELQAYALSILTEPSLAARLAPPPPDLSDAAPGEAIRILEPVRPPRLHMQSGRRLPKMPSREALKDPMKRAFCLHRFANHELMAVEIMAFALLAWPDMPKAFRRGILKTLHDEQRHLRLYIERMSDLGMEFGSQALNDHFWRSVPHWTSPLHYLATMALMFENANLDHAKDFAQRFESVGDETTARLMLEIQRDEIRHVAFGAEWFRRLKDPKLSTWAAFEQALHFPDAPNRARGPLFDRQAREAAHLDPDFIDRLEALTPGIRAPRRRTQPD